MAQQSYKKFVASAATATLVASALIPAASANVTTSAFTDVPAKYKDAVDFVVSNNISSGLTATSYGVDKQIKRVDAASMIAAAAGLNDKDAPASGFKDVPARAAVAVNSLKAAGVVSGKSATNFGSQDNITRGEAAIMLQKAFKLKAGDTKNSFTDVKDSYDAAVDALVANKVTNGINATQFGTGNPIKRGDFAQFLFALKDQIVVANAVETVTVVNETTTTAKLKVANKDLTAADFKVLVDGEAVTPEKVESDAKGEVYTITHATLKGKKGVLSVNGKQADFDFVSGVQVESVKATNAKTVTVTFDKAVEDTTKANIELLRGAFKQNVTLAWADDKKSVQLVSANNLQAADYTVKVTGLGENTLTGSVTIQAQKVASIEILDEVAVVDATPTNSDGTFAPATKATVSYVVKDQYGTDITKTTDLATNDSSGNTIKADKTKGVIELSGSAVSGKRLNDIVPVVLIDTKTGTSVSKTVKLSATATVSSIEVAGIYNAKGEKITLNDKSKAADAFIVLDLKDQYGKAITKASQATGLVITNTNPTNLTVASSVSDKKIGDKDQVVINISDIKKAGNTDLLMISTTNGQSAKYTVEVAETATTDAISVSQPEIAVKDEVTLVPITVTDKEGNVITDRKLLADPNKGIKVDGSSVAETAFEVKDGQVYYKTTFTGVGNKAMVFQTSNFKIATITVDVKAVAKATAVRGLKNPLVLSTQQGPVVITAEDHLVIEDQYGRAMKASLNPAVTVSLVGTSDVVSVGASNNTVTPLKNGKATLKVALTTENGTIDSAVEVPVQVTDGTEYSAYEIGTIGKTQVGKAKPFTVNGILNDGKVALKASEYTATLTGGTISGARSVTSPITVAAGDLNKNTATPAVAIDTEFTLKVTINATGKVLEQKFVVSPDASATEDFFFTAAATSTDLVDYNAAKAITEATLVSGSTVAGLKSTGDTPAVVTVATVDQYGNKAIKTISADTVTIVPSKVADVTVTDNGTEDATVALKSGVTESLVTYKVTIDGVTKDIKVKVVAAGAPDAPTGLASTTPGSMQITGLNSAKKYEYKLVGAPTYTTVADSSTTIDSLVAGKYVVREKANPVTAAPASADSAVVTVQNAAPAAPSAVGGVNKITGLTAMKSHLIAVQIGLLQR